MIRRIALLTVFLAAFGAAAPKAHAQAAALEAANAQQAQKPPAAPVADPAQVKDLIQTLNDPAQRAKLIQQLNLLTQQQAAKKQAEAEPFGTRVLHFLMGGLGEARDEVRALGHGFVGIPAAFRWFEHQLENDSTRGRWVDFAESLAAVLAGGALGFLLAYLAVLAPTRSLERRHPATVLSRFFVSLLRFALDLIPIAVAGFAGYSIYSTIAEPAVVDLATLAIINAVLLVLTVRAVSRLLLSPAKPGLRVLPMRDRPARFLQRWALWIAALLSFGWFGVSGLRLLGMPKVAAAAALKLDALVVLAILVWLIIRKRRGVANWIRGGDPAMPAASSTFLTMRRRLADVWHLLAVAYLIVTFGVLIFDVPGGMEFALRITVGSFLVIGGARLFVLLSHGLVEKGAAFSHVPDGSFPRLRQRVELYLPFVRSALSTVIWLIAVLILVDVWGIGAFSWFDTPAGEAALGRFASIVLVVVSAVVAWEFVSAIIENYLVGAIRNGSPVERSQRVRTLLPLLRNAFLIFLIVVVILIVLSEVGLNIAPLLAGAGVVGLAIGFGAQTLVKDIITGMFILFENTIAVGDVVDVGGGHSGLVEHFSIRTLRLRDGTGGVHTIPFSAVTSVNNMSKDFSNYVFNIKVDYGQDTDRVVQIMKDLGKEMQDDPAYAKLILAPLDVFGVDAFNTEFLVIQASFKTKPLQQWSVGREFNRRLKKKFDEADIPMKFSQNFVMLPGGEPASETEASVKAKPAKKG